MLYNHPTKVESIIPSMTETKVSLFMEVLLMAENPFGEHGQIGNADESICIDAQRIYDSCGEQDITR